MHMAAISEVKLRPSAADALTHTTYQRTNDWLKQWTPENNFKAVVAGSFTEALDVLRVDLKATMIPNFLASSGVKPEHFEFRVIEQEIRDGRFWSYRASPTSTWFLVQ